MPHPVIDAAERNRRELLRKESEASAKLIKEYEAMYAKLRIKIEKLKKDLEDLDKTTGVTVNKTRQLLRDSSLLQQMTEEIQKYGGKVSKQLKQSEESNIDLALDHSKKLTQSYFNFNKTLNTAFNATWDRLPTEAVATTLGFLSDDSPLHTNLTRDLGQVATNVFEQNLLEGMALGYNSKKTASIIDNSLGQPLSWTLNSVRTANMWAYRQAANLNYLNNSDIVDGWTWYAALDPRTCMSCYAQHGRFFNLGQTLNDHHSGRCVQIPHLYNKFGLDQPEIATGENRFNKLPQTEQISRMGRDKYQAYKQGKFKFSELSEEYQNDVYGTMLKERSLKSLLGKEKPKASVSVPFTPKTPKPVKETKKNPLTDKFPIDEGFTTEVKTTIENALDSINKIHTLPKDAASIPITPTQKDNSLLQGQYIMNEDRAPKAILLNNKAYQPFETFVHEFGHYIDYHLFSYTNQTAVGDYDVFEEWRNAVEASKAVKTLQAMYLNPNSFDLKVVDSVKMPPDQAYTAYLLQKNELWARSYAQYISVKSNNMKDINEQLAISAYSERQWETEDFKPIELAIDNLFRSLGWLK